jgi:hypothetical protein
VQAFKNDGDNVKNSAIMGTLYQGQINIAFLAYRSYWQITGADHPGPSQTCRHAYSLEYHLRPALIGSAWIYWLLDL